MSEGEGRAAPSNVEAEMSVLSAMLLSSDTAGELAMRLEPADFYKAAHAKIFEVLCALVDDHIEADHVTVAEHLTRLDQLEMVGGKEYLFTLSEYVPSAASALYHAEIVHTKAVQRRLIRVSEEIAERAYSGQEEPSDLLDDAERQIFEIARKGSVGEPMEIKDVVHATFERIEHLRSRDGELTGVPTGFVDLDDMTAGLQPGELLILAARPSMGKTSFAMNCMERAANNGYSVAFFSLEMTSQNVVQNLLCCRSQVDAHRLRRGRVSDTEYQRLRDVAGELYQKPIYIDDTAGLSIQALRAKVRRLKQKHNIQILFIDYLQLLNGGSRIESRQQEISLISRSLKALAKELEMPVVALSQLNRSVEQRDSHKPRMSDLRESARSSRTRTSS
jgi:replicative DNA helicase